MSSSSSWWSTKHVGTSLKSTSTGDERSGSTASTPPPPTQLNLQCKHRKRETECEYCTMSVAWAIVKDAKGMRETGHDRAVTWARGWLGLEDQKDVVASRVVHGESSEGVAD